MNYPRPVCIVLTVFLLVVGQCAEVLAEDIKGVQRARLDNGLTVLFHHNPVAVTLAVCSFINVSAAVETSQTAGIRSYTHQLVLASEDAAGLSLEDRAADAGIQVSAQVTPDYVETAFITTTDQLAESLEFVRELLAPGRASALSAEVRKTQLLRQVAVRSEFGSTYARDLALAYLYRDTPFAWDPLGTQSALASLNEQAAATVHGRYYTPRNTVVTVSGNVTWDECRSAVERTLAGLLPGSPHPQPPVRQPRKMPAVLIHRPWQGDTATVTAAAVTPRLDSEHYPVAAVLTTVLGSGEGSRLFHALRYERGLAYSISASLSPSRVSPLGEVQVSCDPQQAAEVFTIMQAELNRLRSEPPTAAEIERAQAYLVGSYVLGRQRNSEVAHYLGLFELLAPNGANYNFARRIRSVTPADTAQAVNWFFTPVTWVQIGGARPGQ